MRKPLAECCKKALQAKAQELHQRLDTWAENELKNPETPPEELKAFVAQFHKGVDETIEKMFDEVLVPPHDHFSC
jgi:hypothetical protein